MNKVKDIFNLRKELHQEGEIGIEIEVEGDDLPGRNKYWSRTDDGSLRGNSAEYVLVKPLDRKGAFDALDHLSNAYKKNGSVIHDSIRTGVHVHINIQDMTLLQFYNFLVTYFILEELLVTYCGPSREGNLFCLRASDAKYMLKAIKDLIVGKRFMEFNDNDLRYGSVNITSVPKYGSLEFRAMRGTKDLDEIKTWIDLLLKVRDYSAKFDNPIQIIQEFSEGEYDQFAINAFGPMFKLFKGQDVRLKCKRGMRNAQVIAYAADWKKYISSIQHNIFLNVGIKAPPPRPEPVFEEPDPELFEEEPDWDDDGPEELVDVEPPEPVEFRWEPAGMARGLDPDLDWDRMMERHRRMMADFQAVRNR